MSEKALFVRSTAHTALTLMEPNPNPEKPGDSAPLRSVVIASSGRPGVPAVTKLEGDDAEAFRAWAKANPNSDLLRSGVLTEGSDEDEDGDGEIEFGHEIFLERAEGSGSTENASAGKVKASRQTPKGPGKPNDGPGEPRHASQPGEPEPKKTAAGGASGGPEAPKAADATKAGSKAAGDK